MRTVRFTCCHCRRSMSEGRPGQRYCGEKECQRARKRAWSREKYASDLDYRINQKESTDAWLKTQGGAAAYHRRYRRQRQERRLEEQEAAAMAAEWKVCARRAEDGKGEAKDVRNMATARPVMSLFALDVAKGKAHANRDADPAYSSIESGLYKILPLSSNMSANRDARIYEIREVSRG